MEKGSPFHGEGCFCYHIDCSDIVSACIDSNHDSKYLQTIFESQLYLSKTNVFNFRLNFFQPLLTFMCLYTYMNACHSICVEVRRWFVGAGPLFLLYESQGSNSDCVYTVQRANQGKCISFLKYVPFVWSRNTQHPFISIWNIQYLIVPPQSPCCAITQQKFFQRLI